MSFSVGPGCPSWIRGHSAHNVSRNCSENQERIDSYRQEIPGHVSQFAYYLSPQPSFVGSNSLPEFHPLKGRIERCDWFSSGGAGIQQANYQRAKWHWLVAQCTRCTFLWVLDVRSNCAETNRSHQHHSEVRREQGLSWWFWWIYPCGRYDRDIPPAWIESVHLWVPTLYQWGKRRGGEKAQIAALIQSFNFSGTSKQAQTQENTYVKESLPAELRHFGVSFAEQESPLARCVRAHADLVFFVQHKESIRGVLQDIESLD